MFEKKDNRRRNFMIVARLLGLGGLLLILLSRTRSGPERDVYRKIGITLIIGLLIVRVWFTLKPDAFKDKSANPDEQAD